MRTIKKDDEAVVEVKEILTHFDVGKLITIEPNQRGFCNTSFNIVTEKDGQKEKRFFRKYKQSIQEEELLFEHSLIEHLVLHRDLPVARLSQTKDGRTYTKRRGSKDYPLNNFYALFDFLPGEDRYTWVNPHCTHSELKNIARIFALFHSAVSDFQPKAKRFEPKILELLSNLNNEIEQNPGKSKNTIFDETLRRSQNAIQVNIQTILHKLHEAEALQMPQTVIHCDFHPGNLRFQRDSVSGLFDFDWSKVDFRCFDVGLALWYFFTEWEGSQDGELRSGEANFFLKEYQNAINQLPGIGPLNSIELEFLPLMISAGNFYILNWTLLDYYSKEVDPVEYLKYLDHGIHFIDRCGAKGIQNII